MSDPFRNLPRGTPLTRITSDHIRGWNEAARAEMQRQQGEEFETGGRRRSSTIVDVLNDSGGDLDEFAVVRLASAAITYDENAAEFKYQPAANVDAPGAATDQDVIGVLLDPLVDGAIGRATILGLTPVLVEVPSGGTAWKWAGATSGETGKLTMQPHPGAARVIDKQSGTGEKWALVCLMGSGAGDGSFWAEITQRGPKPNYTYGFNAVYDLAGTWTDLTGGAEGIAAAWADITQISTTVANLVIRNATGGTFTVTADGTTAAQAYNVSSGSLQTAINGVLGGGVTVVITGSGTDGSPFVLTFSSAKTPTVNYASLTPNTSTAPAREVHNRKILTGSIVRIWPGDGEYWFSELSTTPVTVCVSGGGSATILAGVPNDA